MAKQQNDKVQNTIDVSVKDRLLVANLIPSTGTIKELLAWKKFKKTFDLTEEEKTSIDFTNDGVNLTWNPEKAQTCALTLVVDEELAERLNALVNSDSVIEAQSIPSFFEEWIENN